MLKGLAGESGQFDTPNLSRTQKPSLELLIGQILILPINIVNQIQSELTWSYVFLPRPLESSDWQSACSVFIANSTLQFLADAGCSEFEGPDLNCSSTLNIV